MSITSVKFLLALLCTLQISDVAAQQANVATGGNGTGSGGTICFSVGQVVYTSISGSSNTIGEGVQQPYEVSQVVAIEAHNYFPDLMIYPNPAIDQIVITLEQIDGISYSMYDALGKIIQRHLLVSTVTSIDMSDLCPATYFITLTGSHANSKTYKIIKN